MTALYRAQAVGLIRLAVIMLGDRAAAEDAVQDAFLGLYRHWGGLSDDANALTYVRASVLNGCRNALRQRAYGILAPYVVEFVRKSIEHLSTEHIVDGCGRCPQEIEVAGVQDRHIDN